MIKQRRNLDAVSCDNEERITGKGKKPHHKIKPYVVLQYLLKYTDENHMLS